MQPVALLARHQREAEARVAGGGLDERAARLDAPFALGGLDERSRPTRSLIEPPGFWFSSFRNSWHGPVSSRRTASIGVRPIISSAFGIQAVAWEHHGEAV